MALRSDIDRFLRITLSPERFRDYGPNGLQAEGRAEVRRVVSGVTASLATIEAAIDDGADALIVRHGLFWRGQDGRLTGWLKQRVARLLGAEPSLFAFHLPLDAHPVASNNAQFGPRLGLVADATFAEQALGFDGAAGAHTTVSALAEALARGFGLQHRFIDLPNLA